MNDDSGTYQHSLSDRRYQLLLLLVWCSAADIQQQQALARASEL